MVTVIAEGGKTLGSLENSLMGVNDSLQVWVYQGCLNCLNGMELGNDARMTFFELLFNEVGIDEL
jgi:hypothetical protein